MKRLGVYSNRKYVGVYAKVIRSGEKRYYARLWNGKKLLNLGAYDTASKASIAYQKKLTEHEKSMKEHPA